MVQSVVEPESLTEFDAFVTSCRPYQPTYVLFDASTAEQRGGTGKRADWYAIRDARTNGCFKGQPPVILAGGLNPDNVADAIRTVLPAGVDVSSGVEEAPGQKDHAKIVAFVSAVHAPQR